MIFARPYKFLRNGGYTRSSNKKEECICLENTMQKTGLRRGLTTAQLKWIALVLMVLDHIHYFFEFTGAVPLLFSQLGRLSAGLFLFCLIEGFIHTHDRRRYFLRIYLVSVGMGAVQFCCILFDFCRRPDGFYPMNQMLATFAVLLPMLQGVDWLRQKRWLRGLAALVLPFAWPFFMLMVIYPMFPQAEGWLTLLGFTVLPMHTMIMDGGTLFILCGLLMYLCRLKSTKLEALAFAAFYLLVYGSTAVLYRGATWDFIFNQAFEWMGAFSAVFMLLYNGQRGASGRGGKYFFYVFYPAHVYVLYGLSWLLYLWMQ